MRAAFTLIPAESRRLIAKAVVQMDEVKNALKSASILINPGTTNCYIAQELLGWSELRPERFAIGSNTHRLLCLTDPAGREKFPIILEKGLVSDMAFPDFIKNYRPENVIFKGANAIDAEGNVGLCMQSFDGGGMGKMVGTVVTQGGRFIVAVGLEKLVPSVKEAVSWTGAQTVDYRLGADFGMIAIPNALVVTEIQALNILAGVEAKHVASGGVGASAGSVVLVILGEESNVRKAMALVESIKGEPTLPGFKGICESCSSACKFVGTKEEDLPVWLKD